MPRIKMVDDGGYQTEGEGVEIDIKAKMTKSNEGCIQGWVNPVSGSLASGEIIVGSSFKEGTINAGSSNVAQHPPYDGSNVIDMTNFVRVGNVIKVTVYIAIKDEVGNPGGIRVSLQASDSKYHIYLANEIGANIINATDITDPEFHTVEFVNMIYNTDDLTRVQMVGYSLERSPLNDPDVEGASQSLENWDSVGKPYWHVCIDMSGTENSTNYYGMKITTDTEFIGKRSD